MDPSPLSSISVWGLGVVVTVERESEVTENACSDVRARGMTKMKLACESAIAEVTTFLHSCSYV